MGILSKTDLLWNKVSDIIFNWIKSWFYEIETHDEFSDSFKSIESFMVSNKAVITTHYSGAISKNISRIVKKIEKCGEHYFKTTVTLGFKGSSIVEATNPGIKRGDFAAKATHSIETSTYNQLSQVDDLTQRRNVAMAKKMNSHQLWSRSNTSKTLTEYMEGLVCKYYDNRYVLYICSLYMPNLC